MNVTGARRRHDLSLEGVFAKVEEYGGEKDLFIQLFDPRRVIGKEHLFWAYDKARYCFDEEENRADSLEMETLLWASGEGQIKDALDKIGLHEDSPETAVMIEEEPDGLLNFMDWEKEDSLLEPSLEKLKEFGVTEEEIDTVEEPYELVFERMALSTV